MTRSHTIKARLTTSVAPLPVVIALTVVIWLWRGSVSVEGASGIALMLLTTFILRQVSNTLQLIRVRSWAVSTVFVILMAIGAPIHQWNPCANAMGVFFMLYIIGLLASYQSRKPQVSIFWGTAALMTCSLLVPKLLWLIPIIILSMLLPLRCCTSRSLVALLLGILLPYELWGAWNLYNGTIVSAAVAHWQGLTSVSIDYLLPQGGIGASAAEWEQVIGRWFTSIKGELVIFLALYGIISIFHFFRTSLDDKTRTRMLYISLMLHWPVLMLILLLHGGTEVTGSFFESITASQSAMLWPPLCLVSSPLLAHYFVFSKRWAGSIMFWLFILLCLFLVLQQL